MNRKYALQVVAEFNRLTRDELAEKLRPVPTRNLVLARDAARDLGRLGYIPAKMVAHVADAVTDEINRRWEA